MSYRLIRTQRYDAEVTEIIQYILIQSGDPDIAEGYYRKIQEALRPLEGFPYSGTQPRYPWAIEMGFRMVPVQNHLIFYKVDEAEKCVIIYTIQDRRREYWKYIY